MTDHSEIAAVFQDGKDAGALRTIGEVARALGLRQHVLRYWEDQFPTLRPLTRAGGRRYYRPEDIALLITIDRLVHRDGYTIRGARAALAMPAALTMPAARRVAASGACLALPTQTIADDPAAPGQGPEQDIVTAVQVLRRHLESIRARLAAALD
ncbi:MerR family transcriptional regulator [Novosphingobium sp.]|uniref:MerR family transcriptional regulator n=1 Tax=Novosphingobium sp. TaxID=1874826 RepID=UPI00333EC16E